jgi:hypothetical protein
VPIGVRGTDRAAWPLGEPSAECCLDTLCVCCLRWCGAGLLAGFSLARRATFLDDRRFFFLSICTRGWCRRARLSSARGGLSRMVLSARCGCRRAHLTPPHSPVRSPAWRRTPRWHAAAQQERVAGPAVLAGGVQMRAKSRQSAVFCCAMPCTHPCIARPAQCVFAHPPMCADGLQRILRGRGHARVSGGWE